MARILVSIGNTQAGSSANEAVSTFWIGPALGLVADHLAQCIAFCQYMLPAAGTYISGAEYSVAPTGGTLPLTFPTAPYTLLQGADANLAPMAAFGVSYGFNALTTLGSGAVISKRTTTPGRSGRGRMTTPWLPVSWVDAQGSLAAGGPAIITEGWDAYMRDAGPLIRSATVRDLFPYVNSATGDHLVTQVTVSDRLGHLRSRTR